MSNLEKINILTKEKLDSLDLTQYKNQLFGTTDDTEDKAIAFAESERQKSKNLLKFPYGTSYNSTYGITFTNNGDGTFTVNGQQSSTSYNSVQFLYIRDSGKFKLPAGTYTISLSSTSNAIGCVFYDGTIYHNVYGENTRTFTITEEKTFEIYLQVGKTTTTTLNNVKVYPMIVEGTEAGEWQPYNGAIVHEKEAQRCDLVYDEKTKPIPLGNTVAYTTGIWGTINMDLSKYKYIRAYYRHLDYTYTMVIHCDVGNNGSLLQLATDNNILATLVSCTKTSFTLVKNGYYTVPSMGFNDRTGGYIGAGANSPEDYAIYRIEGVY